MTDYRDKMTLGAIKSNDMEMSKDAIKNARRHRFFNPKQAFAFQGDCLKKTLDRLGVEITPLTHPKIVDRMMVSKDVVVEYREAYKGEDNWRNGIYVYQRGELVSFISSVFLYDKGEKSPFEINREDEWFVITNAKGV